MVLVFMFLLFAEQRIEPALLWAILVLRTPFSNSQTPSKAPAASFAVEIVARASLRNDESWPGVKKIQAFPDVTGYLRMLWLGYGAVLNQGRARNSETEVLDAPPTYCRRLRCFETRAAKSD
jgi:hypothetical protein